MATINLSNLCFAYGGGESLFSNVFLQIDLRWKLGLIGRNGRGKTTLLRLLHGELACEGRIDRPVRTEYFPYPVEDPSRRTTQIVEEIAEAEPWQIERELSLMEVAGDVLDRPFETLSGGERTKILLAALFLRENRFLLIDEPTTHLDLDARKTVGEYLCKKSGFILVSHDRVLLDRCVDHILMINRSDFELMQGNYSIWRQSRDCRDKFEQAENRRLRKDIRRLNDSARQSAEWSRQAEKGKYGNGPVDRGFIGGKAARMMKHAKTTEERREKAVEEKSTLFHHSEIEDRLSIEPLRFRSTRLVDLSDVSVRYGDNIPFERFSLSVDAGERIALSGRNGSGKSSLLKLIAGEIPPHEGRRAISPSLKISYLSQDASFLQGSLRHFLEQRSLDESRFKAFLHKLGFAREDFQQEKELSECSAGQKKKILLAASLCQPAHLYLWDEPLNYIDVISRGQIENLLLESRPTLIFVEHDEMFLETVATKKVRM